MAHTIQNDLRRHLTLTGLAIVGLFANALAVPALFRAVGLGQPVQSTLPDAPLWLLILAIVVFAPVGEEFLFRKWLLSGFQWLSLSFVMSATLSTALWVASHIPTEVQSFLIYTIAGAILCWLRYQTQRIWTCIMAHMAYNAPAVMLLTGA